MQISNFMQIHYVPILSVLKHNSKLKSEYVISQIKL